MRARVLQILIPLVILLGAAELRFLEPAFLLELRSRAFDLMVQLEPRTYQAAPVRIVEIDDESLRRFGQWPWPRTLLARMVERLQNAGVAVIALDIILAEPDRTSPDNVLERIGDFRIRSQLAGEMARYLPLDNDEVLADTIRRGAVITAFALTHGGGLRAPMRQGGFAFVGENPTHYIPTLSTTTASLSRFEEAAAGNGFVSLIRDRDGVVRSVPLILGYKREADAEGEFYPSLAIEALRVAQGASTILVKASGSAEEGGSAAHTGIQAVRVGAFTLPTHPTGQMLLYPSGHDPRRYLSAWQVLDERVDLSVLQGNIVFIGASAIGLLDIHSTALDNSVPGVEVQAEVVEQAIFEEFLHRPFWADWVEIAFIIFAGLLIIIAFAVPGLDERLAALGSALAILVGLGVTWYAFTEERLLLDPIIPSLATVAVYIGAAVTAYLQSEGERRFVRGAFSQYLAPTLVERIAKHNEALKLGGETRELTILFSDIRGFTGISERLGAEEVTRLINRYLTPMTAIIMEQSGTIDKYMGDAIMAFWNAPLDDDEHAQHAVAAVLEMRDKLVEINEELESEAQHSGRAPVVLRVGYGLATGNAHVGNMGSDQRFDYTVLGDTVNLSSRLEGQSATYRFDGIVSEETQAKSDAAFLELDLLRVKGRDQPLRIFALVGDAKVKADADFTRLVDLQMAFLEAYRHTWWDAAEIELGHLNELAPRFGLQGYFEVMQERITAYRAEPPPRDWQGVFDATTK